MLSKRSAFPLSLYGVVIFKALHEHTSLSTTALSPLLPLKPHAINVARFLTLSTSFDMHFQFTCYRSKTMYWLFMHTAFHMHMHTHTPKSYKKDYKVFWLKYFQWLSSYSNIGYAQLCRIIKFPPLQCRYSIEKFSTVVASLMHHGSCLCV